MSEVVISNLALGFLGDEATVASLAPPEGSVQAEHVSQFFPLARDAVLEMHPWGFATRRATLTLRDETVNGWLKSYDRPANCLKVFAVIPQNSQDDYVEVGGKVRRPQKFKTALSPTNKQIILTNQEDADAIFTVRIEDTTVWSPLFKLCVAKLLASFLAGPIYKGSDGAQMSALMLGHFQTFFSQAIMGSGTELHEDVEHPKPWNR